MGNLKYVVDLDSAYTTIYKLGSGVVLREPTVATISTDGKNKIKALGTEARKFIGKTAENTKVVFPVFEGEIVNENVAGKMLGEFLKKCGAKSVFKDVECILAVPCGATAEMLNKYQAVADISGISKIFFVETPILAALGGRVPITDSTPFFVVNMGSGTTNVAVISLDGVISGFSVNFGVNKITTDIIDFICSEYNIQIGLLTAERLKKEIGSLDEYDGLTTIANGRDGTTGKPKALSLKANEILTPVKSYYDKVNEFISALLSKLPPEVSAEIRHSGIYLSGEGVLCYGIEKFFENKFDIKINVSDNPEYDVCLGGGILLANKPLLKKLSVKIK